MFGLEKAKNSQFLAIALLLYNEGHLNNMHLSKFSNCIRTDIASADIVSIAEKLTELHNSYSHGMEVRIKSSNVLHELLNEIFHLVIYKQIGIGVKAINFNNLYKHIVLKANYSEELTLYDNRS